MAKDMYQKRRERKAKAMEETPDKVGCQKNVINWYPGHMAKTMKQISEDLKLVDVVIEVLDARIPISSQNPEVNKIISNKEKIYVLNKKDLSEEQENNKWIKYFEKENIHAVLCSANDGNGIDKVLNTIENTVKSKKEEAIKKGRIGKIIRVMVIGIPNSGKSSFINRISKRKTMQVGNKPGVTRQKQWIRLSENIELLDTPGVLWPKIENNKIALNLSFTGTIKDNILDEVEIGYELTKYILNNYKENLMNRYNITDKEINNIQSMDVEENEKIVEIMKIIGENRSAKIKGGEIDLSKTSNIILDDFRSGKLGRISLEKVK